MADPEPSNDPAAFESRTSIPVLIAVIFLMILGLVFFDQGLKALPTAIGAFQAIVTAIGLVFFLRGIALRKIPSWEMGSGLYLMIAFGVAVYLHHLEPRTFYLKNALIAQAASAAVLVCILAIAGRKSLFGGRPKVFPDRVKGLFGCLSIIAIANLLALIPPCESLRCRRGDPIFGLSTESFGEYWITSVLGTLGFMGVYCLIILLSIRILRKI